MISPQCYSPKSLAELIIIGQGRCRGMIIFFDFSTMSLAKLINRINDLCGEDVAVLI